jgi:addiction module RelE/StbE family toxin
MIRVSWDDGFKKSYRKQTARNRELADRFAQNVELLCKDPHTPQLRTHKLSGKLRDCWAFSCGYDVRVVFRFIDAKHILLIDFGSHDEVY